jgi:Tol biopolymer transport system component/tRNA A-37 threonylcarbamoyl transferase component Bud32
MGLTSGTKLGPYEIQSPLGAGGMGEVYRARDTRLERTVAIKILPSHLSENTEAQQRFEREARTISSLNHPNICTLYDVGHQDGMHFLVMEYLEGETLADRLRKGPLPIAQVLKVGMEICEGLERAHRGGVVHRDLKPGNIMLTKSGAKLMDFGLAKPAVVRVDSSSSLTVTMSTPVGSHPLTAAGTVMGTFQYMSPEQVEGKEADARSDIFAFGAVLYEIATGKRAFEGKTAASAMAAVLERSPDAISLLQPTAPAGLDHVVQGCLAKDPDERWQSAGDIARELRWVASGGSEPGTVAPAPVEKSSRNHLVWGAVVMLLLAVLAWTGLRQPALAPTMRSFLPPPPQTAFDFTGDFSGPPVISADGSAIAFCARTAKERVSIWVQSLNELAPKKLEGTEGASFPFWSGDGRFLGFFAEGHLRKIPAEGGPVTTLADAPNPRGGAWNQNNDIIFEPDYRDTLWRISGNGGTPTRLTKFETAKHTTHRWPQFLPDGKHFLFFATNHSGSPEQGIYFGSLDDGSYKHVLDSDSEAQYASGYLIYHLQSQLLAQKFDPAKGTASGDPITLANLVEYDVGTWHTTFTVSQNGRLVYEPGSKMLGSDLVWMDRRGNAQGRVSDRGFYKGAGRLSPDGKRLAVAMGEPQADIWVLDLTRGSRTRLTFGGATHTFPSWSADGQRVVYSRQNGTTVISGTSIRARLANGGGQEEVLIGTTPETSGTLLAPDLSADGRYVVYTSQQGPTGIAIMATPLTGDKKPFTVVPAPAGSGRIIQSRLSPDGHWLAYSSTESGREEIYVTHFPSGQGKWQISQTGGTFPAWRGDNKEIWFLGMDLMLQAAEVNVKGGEFELESVKPLFQFTYSTPTGTPYDMTPDGQRAVLSTFPETVPTPLVLVTNWTGELKK